MVHRPIHQIASLISKVGLSWRLKVILEQIQESIINNGQKMYKTRYCHSKKQHRFKLKRLQKGFDKLKEHIQREKVEVGWCHEVQLSFHKLSFVALLKKA